MRSLILAVAWLVSGVALANPQGPANASLSGGVGSLLQLLLGLLLVLGLIFAMAWLLRRVQQITPRGGQVIRLLSSQALGPRERLLLVQVGEEQLLLGLTAGRITPLHVLKTPVSLADHQPATPEFAQRLMEALGRVPKDQP